VNVAREQAKSVNEYLRFKNTHVAFSLICNLNERIEKVSNSCFECFPLWDTCL